MEISYLDGVVASPAQNRWSIEDIREQAFLSSETVLYRMEDGAFFEIHGIFSGLFASPYFGEPPIQTSC